MDDHYLRFSKGRGFPLGALFCCLEIGSIYGLFSFDSTPINLIGLKHIKNRQEKLAEH